MKVKKFAEEHLAPIAVVLSDEQLASAIQDLKSQIALFGNNGGYEAALEVYEEELRGRDGT
jgi:hypothetical protein